MPRKPTLLPERDSRASAILLQLGSNRLAPTPVRADGRTARLVLDEVASLARRILEDRIGLQTAALEAAPIRREVIERKIEVLAQNPAEAPRHPRGRLSVLRHEAEEHLVQDHLVLEEPRADVVLRCSRQLEVQELRTDVEPFRRQSPDRRPSLRARVPQVSSYHRRLVAHARRQLPQPGRGPCLASSWEHQSFNLFSSQIPTHCQNPHNSRSLSVNCRFRPALFFISTTASIHSSPTQPLPGHPIRSLGVGGREGAKAAARLSNRARGDSPTS